MATQNKQQQRQNAMNAFVHTDTTVVHNFADQIIQGAEKINKATADAMVAQFKPARKQLWEQVWSTQFYIFILQGI